MSAHFELFAGFFVDESGSVYSEFFNFGGNWNRAGDDCAGSFGGVDNHLGSFIDYFVIE